MLVTIRGARGSVPAPGPATVRYGGNTPCIEVQLKDGTELILDAGTGIRALGKELARRQDRGTIFVLLTHPHWDHVHGFPFFKPAFESGWQIHVCGWSHSIHAIRSLLYTQMDGMSFPVEFGELKADIDFLDLGDSVAQIHSAVIEVGLCCHPGGSSCFRIQAEGSGSLVYVTDNELGCGDPEGRRRRDALLTLCQNADVLIHDAQFLPEELEHHRGWGHSSYEEAVEFAAAVGAKHLVLFHHDPDRSDEQVDQILLRARKLVATRGYTLLCEPAHEGMQIAI